MVDDIKEFKEPEELKELEDDYKSFMEECIKAEIRIYEKRLCFKKQYFTGNA